MCHAGQRGLRAYSLTCQHVKRVPTFHSYVPKCQCANKRAKVLKLCQFFNLTCQRAKYVPIFETGVPMCQKTCQFLELVYQCAKRWASFSTVFQKKIFFNIWIFQLWLSFANFNNFWAILENLSRERKNLNFWYLLVSPYML